MDISDPPIASEEKHESPDLIDQKAQLLADLIKKSKHFIVFTGAGVSTSAGIPDFRGPDGNWTLRAQGKVRKEKVNTQTAVPTLSHMALVELQDKGYLKFLVSQNCDGLHRRSGILPDRIAELHGNSNRECCKDCGKEYLRDFRAVATYEHSDTDHRTGRKCDVCRGPLLDTIINFNEYLSPPILEAAYTHAKKSDLCLVLDSSLTIPPANKIPTIVGKKKNAKLVICNLQETELDELSSLRVFGRGDELMVGVMEKLGLEIPRFRLRRRLVVLVSRGEGRVKWRVELKGVDLDVGETPVTFCTGPLMYVLRDYSYTRKISRIQMRRLKANHPRYLVKGVKVVGKRTGCVKEPFVVGCDGAESEGGEGKWEVKVLLEFMGHYGEPGLGVCHVFGGDGEGMRGVYDLVCDPVEGVWEVERIE